MIFISYLWDTKLTVFTLFNRREVGKKLFNIKYSSLLDGIWGDFSYLWFVSKFSANFSPNFLFEMFVKWQKKKSCFKIHL